MKSLKKQVIIFPELCKGCGLCIEKCPVKAIAFSKSKLGYLSTPTVEINNKKCISCGICELYCPESAILVNTS